MKSLSKGAKQEMAEHRESIKGDMETARKIAADHLREDPGYYDKEDKADKKVEKGEEPAKVKVKVKIKGSPSQVASAMETMHVRSMRAIVKKEKDNG